MLTVFVLFILKYFFYGYFLVGLLVPAKVYDSKSAFASDSLEFVLVLAEEFGDDFLFGRILFFVPFKNLIGFCS